MAAPTVNSTRGGEWSRTCKGMAWRGLLLRGCICKISWPGRVGRRVYNTVYA